MTQAVNSVAFSGLSAQAAAFYRRHGFVVLENAFSPGEISGLTASLERLQGCYAAEMGLSLADYRRCINQWRDLWKQDATYRRLLHDRRQHETARFFMGESGVQLLHDHVISKPHRTAEPGRASESASEPASEPEGEQSTEQSRGPASEPEGEQGREQSSGQGTNATLPWHQDFPFWPVNSPNSLSLWMPLEDVSVSGGCMQVVRGSHRWGAAQPVDFIMDDPERFRGRDDLHLVRIPAGRGMTVVLHSLTWHRSHPNRVAGSSRPAYITLWIPAWAQYTPDRTRWHPLNDSISVAPGRHLNTDHFPLFGTRTPPPAAGADGRQPPGAANQPRTSDRMDMFDANRHVARQINRLLGRSGLPEQSLLECLKSDLNRARVSEACIERGYAARAERPRLLKLLGDLYISAEAYHRHRARNVFNDAYAGWWNWIGAQMQQRGGE